MNELYLDALGLYTKLFSTVLIENVDYQLKEACYNFLKNYTNVLLTKETLSEALNQNLIYLKCEQFGETNNLTITCFTEDIFIVDVILNYVGNIPVNVYINGSIIEHLCQINLQELKCLIFEKDPLDL